jgi:hypothetical protein
MYISINTAAYSQYYFGATNSPIASATASKIQSFHNLSVGWHYGTGGPINNKTINTALDLHWHLIIVGFINTNAFPGSNGEIQLTAYYNTPLEQHYIGIMIEPTGDLGLVYEISGRDGRQPIETTNVETIKAAVREIAGEIWSTFGIFTPRISTMSVAALQRWHLRNQALMDVFPLFRDYALTRVELATVSTLQNIIQAM